MEYKYLYLKEPISKLCVAIYILNYFYLKEAFSNNIFIQGYLDDLLTFPIAFPLLLYIFKIFNLRNNYAFPTLKECFIWFLIWSLIFEYVGPNYLQKGTADYIDIVFYLLGLLLLLFGIKYRTGLRRNKIDFGERIKLEIV